MQELENRMVVGDYDDVSYMSGCAGYHSQFDYEQDECSDSASLKAYKEAATCLSERKINMIRSVLEEKADSLPYQSEERQKISDIIDSLDDFQYFLELAQSN